MVDDSEPAQLPHWLAMLAGPHRATSAQRTAGVIASGNARLDALVRTVRGSQPGDRTGPLVWAAHRLREMIAAGAADASAGELLAHAAVAAGIQGGERYARYQVMNVLGGGR
jgi:hypothetical protein